MTAEKPFLTNIQRDRDVALGLLKPSQRDLEHGLALHRECLVAESYSLGLCAPAVAGPLNAELDAGASAIEFKDLYEDQTMRNWATTPALREEYHHAWEASGVSCMFLNAGEEGNDPGLLLQRLARYTWLMDTMPDILARATTAAHIRKNHSEGKHSICFSLNGVPLPGRNLNPRDELRDIKVFAQLGARMMHLTYQRRNPIGDGCGEPNDGGLSDFGRMVIAEMNRLGVIIDLAHTGWRTCCEAARASTLPLLVSHSAVHALSAHIRGKPDEVIKAVLDSGGTMGITNYPAFLGLSGDIVALLDHLAYMVQKFGDDSVTIGTDAAYRASGCEAALQQLRWPNSRPRWENLWPEGALSDPQFHRPEQQQSLAWTNWPLFTVGMVQRGFSEETIRKIVGGNLLRVVEANETHRTAPTPGEDKN